MTKLTLRTGAGGSICAATMALFATNGWKVIAVDKLEEVEAPPGASYRRVDLTVPAEIEDLFEWLAEKSTSLDALVNNAAIQHNKSILETTNDEWERVQATNVQAIFVISRLAYPMLSEASGAIVHVSSVHALATSVNVAAYAASKGSVLALTRAMALEFAEGGVRVNAVLPGAVDTGMLREGLDRGHLSGTSPEAKLEALGSRTALGRVGHPKEIARTILFLADSEQSSYITGTSLVVDGGALARLSTE